MSASAGLLHCNVRPSVREARRNRLPSSRDPMDVKKMDVAARATREALQIRKMGSAQES